MKIDYDLTEPLKTYNYFLKDAVHETANNFFDGLTQKNNIDVEANRYTNQRLAAGRKKIEEVKKSINGKRGLKGFLIFSIILSFILSIVFFVLCFYNFHGWFIACIVGGIGLGVGLIFVVKKLKKNIMKCLEVI